MDDKQLQGLTDRQKDCLRLVGKGFTSKEIGRVLSLSPSTVDNHVNGAIQAMQAPNRGTAARALTDFELGQKLPRQSGELAELAVLREQSAQPETEEIAPKGGSFLSLPPVGGRRNDLDGASRSLRILQVAAVAAVVSVALVILVAGLFRAFG